MSDFLLDLERKQQITGLAQDLLARDMFQAKVLSAMFNSNIKREIVLKGGMAMRAAHNSHRFTKDIDLQSGPEIPINRVKAIVEGAIKSTMSAGILENIVFTNPKSTDTVQRWKVGGQVVGGGSQVHMTIEVSRRGMPDPRYVKEIVYAPSGLEEPSSKAILVDVYSPTAIAATKVDCLLNPVRTAVRDLYDLNFLIVEMRVDPPIDLLKKLGKNALAQAMVDIWPKLEIMTWELAQTDLLHFMPKESFAGLDEESWDKMRLDTCEVVTSWLKQALDEVEGNAPASP